MKLAPLAALVAAFFCATANASSPAFDAFMGRVVGNQTTVSFGSGGTPMATSSAHLGTPSVGNMAVRADSVAGARLEGRAQLPVGNSGKSVPVNVKVPITRANFGKALMLAGKVAWPVGVIMTAGDIYDYLSEIGLSNIRNTPDGITADNSVSGGPESGFYYQIGGSGQKFSTVEEPVVILLAQYRQTYPDSSFSGGVPYAFGSDYVVNPYKACPKVGGGSCQDGNIMLKRTPARCDDPAEVRFCMQSGNNNQLTQQQIEDLVASNTSGWPTSAARALASALAVPGVTVQTEAPVVTGPATVPGQSTTTTESVRLVPGTNVEASPGTTTATDPGVKTTTKTESQKLTYSGNTVTTNNTVNNTTVTITNNTTNQTTVEGDKIEEIQDKEEPKEIETCGLPGKPACKIDETGTPEAKEDKSKTDTEQAIKPLDDFLKDPKAALPQLPTINWAFTLPSGCAPIALPAFDPWLQEIDVCRFQPMFHDIMGFVWVMGGIFGAIGIFWRNTFSQG